MCGQIDTREVEGGVKTKLCERCKDIGHTARYCSRRCQKDDWPQHKLHCGKCDEAATEPKEQQACQDADWPGLAG